MKEIRKILSRIHPLLLSLYSLSKLSIFGLSDLKKWLDPPLQPMLTLNGVACSFLARLALVEAGHIRILVS